MVLKSKEQKSFGDLMGKLLKVPHSEIKAKLEKEKEDKRRKKSKRSSSASRASHGDGQ